MRASADQTKKGVSLTNQMYFCHYFIHEQYYRAYIPDIILSGLLGLKHQLTNYRSQETLCLE